VAIERGEYLKGEIYKIDTTIADGRQQP